MKQAFLCEGGFEVRDVPMPECKADEILLRVQANGVCAGDVGVFKDIAKRKGQERPLGHEGSGQIVEAGPDVRNLRIGDRVTLLGGRFAEYWALPARLAAKLPDNVDPLWALGEPVACCMHAMNRCRGIAASRTAVVGCGFMGLICLQMVRQLGASHITAIDLDPQRLAMAGSFGADECLAASSVTPEILRAKSGDLTGGDFDVVIEAAGNQPALDVCGYLVREHGLINIVGHHYTNGGMRTVYMNQWNWKAIDVVIGHVRRDDEKLAAMRQAMDWAAQGKLNLAPMVTAYPLANIQQAFDDLATAKPGLVKAVIVP